MTELAIVGRQGNPWIDPKVAADRDFNLQFKPSRLLHFDAYSILAVPSTAARERLAERASTLTPAPTFYAINTKEKHVTQTFCFFPKHGARLCLEAQAGGLVGDGAKFR